MNFTIDIKAPILDKTANFISIVEHIQQRVREREITNEQRRIKTYSIIHYIEHIKRCINDNPLIGRALFLFYNTIQNFSPQNNRFSSTIHFDNNESKMSVEDKTSIENLHTIDPKLDLSKISLTLSQSVELNNLQPAKSTTHYIRPINVIDQTSGLMTKATLTAINKAPRQRTTDDIQVLEHLLNTCETLRHLPADVRHYAARSLLLLTYHPHTILTRQNLPPFLVYRIVYGQCKLLLETKQTTIFGHQLNIGDVYGDDSLQTITDHRLNGLITNENNRCNLIGFFSRDIRAYENYLSDMMKQSLLEQLRIQTTFIAIQWRNDILNYFLKWSNYKQYSIDEVIYGNEEYEHNNLYFILHGQVSFVRLLDFPSVIIEHPEFSRYYQKWNNPKNKKEVVIQRTIEGIVDLTWYPYYRYFIFPWLYSLYLSEKNLSFIDNESVSSSSSDLMDINNHRSVITSNSNVENHLNSQRNINAMTKEINNFQTADKSPKLKTTWRFLDVFTLSNGYYFGFESTTIHSWYLTRTTVDFISIPKIRFKELGYFAPMILEKLRQDFLDIYPNEIFIRNSYIKYLKTNKSNENDMSTSKFNNQNKRSTINSRNNIDLTQKSNWIPEQTILNQYKQNLSLANKYPCN